MNIGVMVSAACSFMFALSALAYSWRDPLTGITWEYGDGGGNEKAVVRGADQASGSLAIPDEIAGLVVKEIGDDAFADCTGLISVRIPETVQTVGDRAFRGCTGLGEGVVISDGCVICLNGECPENLVLPEGTRLVGKSIFANQTGLRTLTLPKSIRIIGTRAFAGCSSMGTVQFPEGITEIQTRAFEGCSGMESVVLPSTVQKIGKGAFSACTGVREVEFQEGVRWPGDESFSYCTALERVTFPASFTDMDEHPFLGCTALATVYFKGAPPTKLELSGINKDALIYYNAAYGVAWKTALKAAGFTNIQPIGGDPEPGSLDASYGPFIPGEKIELEIPALVGYSAKGLPSGLKLNKQTGVISGTPKKPTAEAGVKVTFTKKGAETLTAQFIVGPLPQVSVILAGDTEKCKVTGAGKGYLVGKKVTLQAKGPKGTAFVGWTRDGAPWPDEATCRNAKQSFLMPAEDLNLIATFEKERMTINASALEGAAFAAGTKVEAGVVVIGVETQSGLKSLKAKGLPSGLKLALDKTTGVWSVSGTPKKEGTYAVKLTATAKSGAVETVSVVVTINAII